MNNGHGPLQVYMGPKVHELNHIVLKAISADILDCDIAMVVEGRCQFL